MLFLRRIRSSIPTPSLYTNNQYRTSSGIPPLNSLNCFIAGGCCRRFQINRGKCVLRKVIGAQVDLPQVMNKFAAFCYILGDKNCSVDKTEVIPSSICGKISIKISVFCDPFNINSNSAFLAVDLVTFLISRRNASFGEFFSQKIDSFNSLK